MRLQDFQRGFGDEHVNLVVVGDRELRSVPHLVETRAHEEIRLRVEREKEKTKFRKEASNLRNKRAAKALKVKKKEKELESWVHSRV